MRLSNSLKVTFVTIFSCLAIMLGLFSSTGIASAHSANALQSQTSASQSATQWQRQRCFRTIVVRRVFVRDWWWGNQWGNQWGNRWGNGWNNHIPQNQSFQFNDNGDNLFFNPNQFGFFNGGSPFGGHFVFQVTVIRICGIHHDSRNFEFQH